MSISSPSNEPPSRDRLDIDGPGGALEAVAEDPGDAGDGVARRGVADRRYAVVCHPHPLFGGTMDNKVVTTVARALNSVMIPTVRFNFRGVGRSTGVYDAGRGETKDAAAVAEWGAKRWPGRELVIAGFSFGAYVALRLAQERRAESLITIAPALGLFDFSGLRAPGCPWLLVQGEADDVVDAVSVVEWASSLTPRPRLVLMPGVGHLFHGRLAELRDAVIDAIRGG